MEVACQWQDPKKNHTKYLLYVRVVPIPLTTTGELEMRGGRVDKVFLLVCSMKGPITLGQLKSSLRSARVVSHGARVLLGSLLNSDGVQRLRGQSYLKFFIPLFLCYFQCKKPLRLWYPADGDIKKEEKNNWFHRIVCVLEFILTRMKHFL